MREYLSLGVFHDDWQQAFPYSGSSMEVSWQMTVFPVVFSFSYLLEIRWKYTSRVLCPISCAGDGTAPWEEKEREQVICRAPIHSTWVYARGLCEHSCVGQRHGESRVLADWCWGGLSLEMQKAQQNRASPGCPVLLRLLVRSSFGGVAGGVPSRSAWLIWSIPCLSSGPGLVTLEFTCWAWCHLAEGAARKMQAALGLWAALEHRRVSGQW